MNITLTIVLALEMTCVNLYASFICSKHKYSSFVTWMTLLVFTICLFVTSLLIIKEIPNYKIGNGLVMLVGFLYLIPLNFLYDHSTKYLLAIMCSTWIYTVFAFSLSIRVGYLLENQWFYFSSLLFQTLFYVATLPSFLKIIKNKVSYIVQEVDDETLNSLLQLGILWFTTGVLTNYMFVVGESDVLKLINMLLLIFNMLFSFKLFYTSVILNNKAIGLREETEKDSLTKLRNRNGFMVDVQQKIKINQKFSIVFIDLDNFKKINDRHGHYEGDRYLIKFANTIKNLFKDFGRFYRISGDEFVFLYEGQDVDEFCRLIEHETVFNCEGNIKFQGLSLGYASFPQSGNDLCTLLKIADFKMYQNKKEKYKKY